MSSPGRTQIARRRVLASGILGTLVVVGVIVALPRHAVDHPPTSRSPAPPTTTTKPTPDDAMPPAWLAWIAGSLPAGFASEARATPALGITVVVAGDTLWMTESRDADGAVVDKPDVPYRIPIDAFAASANGYAPFVPADVRGDVTHALSKGQAVLGESSAAMRRLGVGGTLVFGTQQVKVGAIVPDVVVGDAELFVSREVAARLGITDDRYLLSLPIDTMTPHRFARILHTLIPDTDVRTVPPGHTPFARIASGVNPPLVTKQIFGEFAAAPSSDPAFFTIEPSWVDAHIQTRTVPLLGSVTCNVALFPPLIAALQEVQAAGLSDSIKVYSGCWASRTVRRGPTAPPSQHAYGAAIDINAPQNPIGTTPTFDRRVVRIFQRHGFIWGGIFLYPDGHHFEWGLPTPPPQGT